MVGPDAAGYGGVSSHPAHGSAAVGWKGCPARVSSVILPHSLPQGMPCMPLGGDESLTWAGLLQGV